MIRKHELHLFCLILQEEFKLKNTLHVTLSRQILFDGDVCMGLYDGVEYRPGKILHKIRINRQEMRDSLTLFATLAHEYAHAWQMENGYDPDHSRETKFDYWVDFFRVRYNCDIISMQE